MIDELGVEKDEVLLIGDSRVDVEFALNADMILFFGGVGIL